jgi:hypothetical protein
VTRITIHKILIFIRKHRATSLSLGGHGSSIVQDLLLRASLLMVYNVMRMRKLIPMQASAEQAEVSLAPIRNRPFFP